MTDIATIRRRLRNLINDRPYGFSVSAAGFSVDISAVVDPSLDIKFGTGSAVNILLTTTPVDTGDSIAYSLQSAIRAADLAVVNFALATVTFDATTGYTVRSGDIGDGSAIEISPASSGNDIASLLKLGQMNGGNEYLQPTPRYTDAQLDEALNFALAAWNGSVDESLRVCSLEDLEDPILTVILYYAWMLLLEQQAGSTVYAYKQKLGGDELALNDIHGNILDLLRYLQDRIDEMKDDIGVSQISVGTLTRYDRQYDMRVPTYMPNQLDHPRFLQLSRVSATSILIEWQESRTPDFANAQIWLADPADSPMVEKFQLTSNQPGRAAAMSEGSFKKQETSSPIYTVARLDNLATQVWHIVIVFQDTRGRYEWSDEYSLDLSDANAQPVLVVTNNRAPGTIPDDAPC